LEADYAREDWPSALRRLETTLEVKQTLQRPEEEIGGTRINRANVLAKITSRFSEARKELEACLALFPNDPSTKAKVLGSLAALFTQQGDIAQAIIQEHRALALCELLPDPVARANSHHNLAIHLERHGTPPALAESPKHQLAALIYLLVTGEGQRLRTSLNNYAIRFRLARAARTELTVPRVAQLLADPAFASLEQWLRQRGVDVAELQAAVDQFLAQARQLADKS
jgi:tetratricopeptide (TPR) repeat protein